MISVTFRRNVLLCILIAFLLLLVQNAAVTAAVLKDRLTDCLQNLIPSLFGCMVCTELLRECGCLCAGRLSRSMGRILHLPPAALTVFAVSQIAGYPVGAMLLARESAQGTISRENAVRFSGVCFGGGPAFLVGLAGVQLFGSAAAGWLMMTAAICSNLLLMLLMPRSPEPAHSSAAVPVVRCNAEAVTRAVRNAMHSLAGICGAVLLFGLLTASADCLHLFGTLSGILHIPEHSLRAVVTAAADITQLPAVFHIGLPYRVLLPLTGGLLSFGGCCAQMQACALGIKGLRLLRLTALRLLAGTITALLTSAALPLTALPESTAVFAPTVQISESGSVFPGMMILCVGLLAVGSGTMQHRQN